jgi:iron complex outermembrane receptor protein
MKKFAATLAILMTSASPSVFAQASGTPEAAAAESGTEGASSSSGIQEIIVTAQRREERLQDVPVSITALSGSALDSRGVDQTLEIGSAVPGLMVSISSISVQPFIRGIGNAGFGPGNDPSVATYVDDVYQSAPMGLLFSLNNIERIEVLKGPQGTLFGRNATGGLINVITSVPTSKTEVRAGIGYANYDTFSAKAYIAGGSDILAADLAATYSKQSDGWGRNLFQEGQQGVVLVNGAPTQNPPVRRDVGVIEQLGLSSKLVFTPSDRTRIILNGRYIYTNSDQGLYRRQLPGAVLAGPRIGGVVQPFTSTGGGFYDINSDVDWFYRVNQYQGSLKIEQELGFATVKSISSYLRATSEQSVPSDANPNPTDSGVSVPRASWRTWTQEIQLLSNDSSPDWLRWIAGGFYLNQRAGYAPNRLFTGQYFHVQDRFGYQTNESLSAFGQATFSLSDANKLTVGGRYTRDRLETEQWFVGRLAPGNTSALGASAANGVITNVIPPTHTRQSSPTWRISLDHKFTPEIMGYVSINKGYKAGSYNLLGNPPGAITPAPAVDPETLLAYEAGLKSDLFDRRLRLNISGYYYDYKDLQIQSTIGSPPVSYLANAAKARVYGLDFETTWAVTDHLTLSYSGSLINAKFKEYNNAVVAVPNGYSTIVNGNQILLTTLATAPGNVLIPGPARANYANINIILPDLSGYDLPRAPKFTSTVTIDWRIPLGDGEATASMNWYHNSGFAWEASNRVREEKYDTVSAQVGYSFAGDHLRASLWVKNLFDKKYYSFKYVTTSGDLGSPASPRTLGVALDWKM